MTKLEEQLVQSYATMVLGGAMRIEEVPETLILIEGAEPSTLRALADIEVARRIIEEANKAEPEPTFTEAMIQRIEATEMALMGLMELMLGPVLPEEPEEPEEPEGPEEGGDI